MLNKILIMMLNHKKQKLIYKECRVCADVQPNGCDYCNIYNIQRDIKDVVRHLKEGKI